MVATPIGHLEDLTPRARRLLASVPVIAAEDTRSARRLLAGAGIKTEAAIVSVHAHNERAGAAKVMRLLETHESALYLSDAGTPGVSDPGAELVRQARACGVRIVPVPGASALTAILSAKGGAPAVPMHFMGFPPAAKKRRDFFNEVRGLNGCVVLFEAPHRIVSTVADLQPILADEAPLLVGRELTKYHEQIVEAPVREIARRLETGDIPRRGEFVLCFDIARPPTRPALDAEALFSELLAHLPPRKAASLTGKIVGADSNALYRAHLAKKK